MAASAMDTALPLLLLLLLHSANSQFGLFGSSSSSSGGGGSCVREEDIEMCEYEDHSAMITRSVWKLPMA